MSRKGQEMIFLSHFQAEESFVLHVSPTLKLGISLVSLKPKAEMQGEVYDCSCHTGCCSCQDIDASPHLTLFWAWWHHAFPSFFNVWMFSFYEDFCVCTTFSSQEADSSSFPGMGARPKGIVQMDFALRVLPQTGPLLGTDLTGK